MTLGKKAGWFACFYFLLFPLLATASTGPWSSEGPVKARLVSSQGSLEYQAELLIGLQLRLQPGWKTYWRTPGAAGAAPELELNHPALEPDPVWSWPAPQRFNLFGLQSYGYSEEIVFPIRYRLNSSPGELQLQGRAHVYACNEVCLPLVIPVRLDIADEGIDWNSRRLLNHYLSRVPKQLPGKVSEVEFYRDSGGLYFTMKLKKPVAGADVFLENYDVYEWPDPLVLVDGEHVRAWWEAKPGFIADEQADSIRFTYVDDLQAFEGSASLSDKPRPINPANNSGTWYIGILAMAWFGGLILNLMPCVLPVLSIKLLKLSQIKDYSAREMRIQLLFTILGILTVFWILALLLSFLKSAGHFVGWGIQFQSPYFLLFLLLLMLVFCVNLMGWLDFRLPVSVQTRLATSGGAGQSSPYLASFIQGSTATLLATPCSAPFLGTAIAFALSQGWKDILLIFTSVGIGLATPYALLIARPGIIQFLPRPGTWMVYFKRILVFGMLLAALWIIWLLNNHFNQKYLMLTGVLATFWLLLWKPSSTKMFWKISARLLIISMFVLLPQFAKLEDINPQHPSVMFQPETIETLLAEEKIVFIDINADWCITCQYNKTFVLDTDEIRKLFKRHDVIFMQADWSLPDETIEEFLQKQGRSGIPFNSVYGPAFPEGELLPELLTTEKVVQAIKNAR